VPFYSAILNSQNVKILLKIKKIFEGLILTLCFLGLLFSNGIAQHAPKRELRAAWIATVANIDWPSKPGLSTAQQQKEYVRLLDTLKSIGMNAVVVQIRPATDAFYPSTYEPWSYWLTGKQGEAPDPYYDPLKFMIREAHKRGMEFHAWCNPYRAVFNVNDENALAPGNPVRKHPDWFVQYGRKKYFKPGLPEVRTYLVKVIKDIVKRYDVDALHFDDYFYPYHIAGKEFPDQNTYEKYGNGLSKADWRRQNVNKVIKMLAKGIKNEKPWVKFGISPFGVWRNYSDDKPRGSRTHAGVTNYDGLYANILLWLKKGWIDYVAPQLYWDFNLDAAPYGLLLKWWAHHTYGRQLYIGQAIYRIGNSGAWSNPDEIPHQIRANRSYDDVKGSIFFSASIFYDNPLGINDSLKSHYYKYPAIPPRMPWIDSVAPAAPIPLGLRRISRGYELHWKDGDQSNQTTQFVIYRFPEGETPDRSNAEYILKIVNKKPSKIQTYIDVSADEGDKYLYEVTALDRLHNESGIVDVFRETKKNKKEPKAIYRGS